MSARILFPELSISSGAYRRVKVLSNGKILAAGWTGFNNKNYFLVSRLNTNGTLDHSFGIGGHAGLSTVDYANFGLQDFALQPDSKIVMTGDANRDVQFDQTAGAARMLENGSVDASFNSGSTPGQNFVSFGAGDDTYLPLNPGRAIRLQTDGKILVATTVERLTPQRLTAQTTIVRFTSDGLVDESYGTKGVAMTGASTFTRSRTMDVDDAGRAVVAGRTIKGIQLTRFDTNGKLDPSFGTNGMIAHELPKGIAFSTSTRVPTKVISLPNGKILAIMNGNATNGSVVGLMRADANGALDTAFGNGGFSFAMTSPGFQDNSFAPDAVVLGNGQIVVLANTRLDQSGFQTLMGVTTLVRFFHNGLLASNFGLAGVRHYPELQNMLGIDAMKSGALVLSGWRFLSGQTITQVAKTVADAPTNMTLLAVKSAKTHGQAGPFYLPVDIQKALGDTVTVEPRAIGNGHTLLLQFDVNIQSVGSVTVVDSQGAKVGSASAAISESDVFVTLNGIADGKRVKVTVSDINGSQSASVSLGFLLGDTDSSGTITLADTRALRARAGEATNAANFIFDLNATGQVSASDIALVKARVGKVLP